MIRREGSRVLIDISEEEFDALLVALGYATGASESSDGLHFLKLANSINEGNPDWIPYEV